MDINNLTGKYTIELFTKRTGLIRQSALNLLSKLKKKGFVQTSGGGRQKRIYTLTKLPKQKENGFYSIINRYSPEKLVPKFEHYAYGDYTVENAVIDGIKIGDVRTLYATMHLFNHVKDWKKLFELAKKHSLVKQIKDLYSKARKSIKVRKMPKRYNYD